MKRKASLRWAWGSPVRAYLRPAFTEEIAKVPASLDSGSKELFIRRAAFTAGLSEVEKHFRK